MCFAFDLLNKFKFTVNWSKLGNWSQKYHWSDAPSKPGKIPVVKFLSAPPVVSCFLFMAINYTVLLLVCRLLSHLTFAYPVSYYFLSRHTNPCMPHSQNTFIARYSSLSLRKECAVDKHTFKSFRFPEFEVS